MSNYRNDRIPQIENYTIVWWFPWFLTVFYSTDDKKIVSKIAENLALLRSKCRKIPSALY